MQHIVIHKSQFANDANKLMKLNDVVDNPNATLSVGYLTGATGCERDDALYILLLLYELYLVDAFLLVYHQNMTENAFLRTKLDVGFPRLPLTILTDDNEEVIVDSIDQLFFKYEFNLLKIVQFITEADDV